MRSSILAVTAGVFVDRLEVYGRLLLHTDCTRWTRNFQEPDPHNDSNQKIGWIRTRKDEDSAFLFGEDRIPGSAPRCAQNAETCGGPGRAAVCAGHQARHYGRHPPAGALGFDHHHPGAELQSVRAPEPHPGSDCDWPEGEIQKERCQKPDGNFWLPLRPRRFGRRAGDSASREAAAKSPERPGNLHPGLQRKGLQSILSASDRGPLTSRGRRARTRGRPGPPESAHRIRVGPVAKGGFSGGGRVSL